MTLVNRLTKPSEEVLAPRRGYDRVAPYYEQWHWFKFWHRNEAPIVRQWLRGLKPGLGLDAGSGTGPYNSDVMRIGHRCVALDLSSQMLRHNIRRINEAACNSPVLCVQGDIIDLPLKSDVFDWVLCSRVLTHVPDLFGPLHEFMRVLRPSGECLITDIHPDHPYSLVTIPMDDEKVEIETHKHSLEDLERQVKGLKGLELHNISEYRVGNLRWKPPKTNFSKLYLHPNTPVFYICRLKKL